MSYSVGKEISMDGTVAVIPDVHRDHARARVLQRALYLATLFLLRPFVNLKIEGKEYIDALRHGPVLVIANHKSYFDSPFLSLCFRFLSPLHPVRFIASDHLFRHPLSRFIVESLGVFPVRAKQGMAASLAAPTAVLGNGGVAAVFPEGKRIFDDGLGMAKRGVGFLGLHFPRVTVVPIAIAGTNHMHGWRFFSRPKVRLVIGAPFTVADAGLSERTPEETAEGMMRKIAAAYERARVL